MKKRDKDQIHQASVQELVKKAEELRKQIVDETLKRQGKTVKNVRVVKGLRQKLAQTLSIKRLKELSERKVKTV